MMLEAELSDFSVRTATPRKEKEVNIYYHWFITTSATINSCPICRGLRYRHRDYDQSVRQAYSPQG